MGFLSSGLLDAHPTSFQHVPSFGSDSVYSYEPLFENATTGFSNGPETTNSIGGESGSVSLSDNAFLTGSSSDFGRYADAAASNYPNHFGSPSYPSSTSGGFHADVFRGIHNNVQNRMQDFYNQDSGFDANKHFYVKNLDRDSYGNNNIYGTNLDLDNRDYAHEEPDRFGSDGFHNRDSFNENEIKRSLHEKIQRGLETESLRHDDTNVGVLNNENDGFNNVHPSSFEDSKSFLGQEAQEETPNSRNSNATKEQRIQDRKAAEVANNPSPPFVPGAAPDRFYQNSSQNRIEPKKKPIGYVDEHGNRINIEKKGMEDAEDPWMEKTGSPDNVKKPFQEIKDEDGKPTWVHTPPKPVFNINLLEQKQPSNIKEWRKLTQASIDKKKEEALRRKFSGKGWSSGLSLPEELALCNYSGPLKASNKKDKNGLFIKPVDIIEDLCGKNQKLASEIMPINWIDLHLPPPKEWIRYEEGDHIPNDKYTAVDIDSFSRDSEAKFKFGQKVYNIIKRGNYYNSEEEQAKLKQKKEEKMKELEKLHESGDASENDFTIDHETDITPEMQKLRDYREKMLKQKKLEEAEHTRLEKQKQTHHQVGELKEDELTKIVEETKQEIEQTDKIIKAEKDRLELEGEGGDSVIIGENSNDLNKKKGGLSIDKKDGSNVEDTKLEDQMKSPKLEEQMKPSKRAASKPADSKLISKPVSTSPTVGRIPKLPPGLAVEEASKPARGSPSKEDGTDSSVDSNVVEKEEDLGEKMTPITGSNYENSNGNVTDKPTPQNLGTLVNSIKHVGIKMP